MTRGLLPTIGMIVVLAPALAQAQTNLDQGKSAAQIFASDCAECHKSQSGLAKGRNTEALTDFLREHYTTSRSQAAALAAYVLGGRSQKPAPDHAGASAEDAKPEAKPESKSESKPDSKPSKRQARQPAKPDDATPTTTVKLQRPGDETAKPDEEANPADQPSIMTPEGRPPAVARSHRKEPKAPATEAPAAVAHAPAVVPDTAPSEAVSPQPEVPAATAAPAEGGDNPSPVPRDDVPD